ncbi:hypothetical protein FK178_05605 [Antarcticibacterium arcticum]|uniref:Hemerythrin-like domain-containing protein n=1 Tax=Antarcticibacterium arcticum TaxID=2585771 RepID=A0A5B8YK52_9FLAO|nr:hypothetical protein [Antarcticibacterium arcticum]QED37217.1 hypothetical protein FK178_05605 [Antarcticibacterium arcticum]
MKNENQNFRYIEWKSPEEMHFSSLQWTSELKFIRDEHKFLEDMLREYTLPIIESQHLVETKEMIIRLSDSEKKEEQLLKEVIKHYNALEIMVDGIDQPGEEKKYRDEHRKLLKEMNAYTRDYRILKKAIFATVSDVLKHQKQKRLLKQ